MQVVTRDALRKNRQHKNDFMDYRQRVRQKGGVCIFPMVSASKIMTGLDKNPDSFIFAECL
ncbi:hypothetical protein KLAF111653_00605 [Klebsiella africana]|uniref:Uncharacterized protein n=1 Tax=Klebsiella africana TaxID=2489010 RepID=A0A8B6IP87_9ENTR|nr:hypothetical protein SB5857_00778 [Klebsiella africana]